MHNEELKLSAGEAGAPGRGVLQLLLISQDVNAQESRAIAPEAREYLENARQIMQSEALNREKIDWEQIRADAFVVRSSRSTQKGDGCPSSSGA